jgi:integrase/recombinase XerC
MKKASEEQIINHYFLSQEQIEEIRADLYKTENNKWKLQDQLLFELSLYCGNRIGALSKLTLSSLNLDEMVFENIREKEGYRVEVSMDETCKDMIETWLEMRKDDYDHLECDALFIHKHEGQWKPWSKDMISDRMRKFGKIIGIEDFHAHCMRKTAINQIYEQTGDLNLASQWANHKSSAVTQSAYIKPASKSDLREKLKLLKAKQQELLEKQGQ